MIYYETYNEENYLAHHGVKGMKWGVRKQRYSDKMNRQIGRYNRREERIMNARSKNRSKIERHYDKKISKYSSSSNPVKTAKAKGMEMQKKAALKDFDSGTRLVKSGTKRATNIVKAYKNAKLKAFEDSAYKKSPEYKKAIKEYVNQKYVYGYDQSVLGYAMEAAAADKPKKKK